MKKIVFLVSVLLGGFSVICGQQTGATPQATPFPTPNVRDTLREIQNSNRRFDAMRNGRMSNMDSFRLRQIFFQTIEPLYRKPTREEMKLLAPSEEDLRKYAAFLKLSKTGIVKLIEDFGCADNPGVVVATENCLKYSMPGAGSSYSFRANTYRIRRLADLTLAGGSFYTTGVWLHGILVNLGDILLEEVSLETRGAKILNEFYPSEQFVSAAEAERQIAAGIERDGFFYQGSMPAEENATFLLRSIAYRGTYYRAVQRVTYNELDFDKREDVLIAFRVVRKDADGSLTILWRELSSKRSPKLIIEKEDEDKIRENKFFAETK